MEEPSLAERAKAIEDAVRVEAERTAAYIDEELSGLVLEHDGRRYVWNNTWSGGDNCASLHVEASGASLDLETRVGKHSEVNVRLPDEHARPLGDTVWSLVQQPLVPAYAEIIAALPAAVRNVADVLRSRIAAYIPEGQMAVEEPSRFSTDVDSVASLYRVPLEIALARAGGSHEGLAARVDDQRIQYDVRIEKKHGLQLRVAASYEGARLFTVFIAQAPQRKPHALSHYSSPATIQLPGGKRESIAKFLRRAVQWESSPEGFQSAMRKLVPAVRNIYTWLGERIALYESTKPERGDESP